MKKFLPLFFLFVSSFGFATHNRAGEITYKRIAPFTQLVGGSAVPYYNYLITVTKYTGDGTNSTPNNPIQDRCVDTVYFGDGSNWPVQRSNGSTPLCVGCYPCGCAHCGELIVDDPDGYRVKVNTYTVTHVYPGAGRYLIHSTDPSRNEGVHNMLFSGQQSFYLESLLIITNFSGANSSPVFLNPPVDKACIYKCFYHNPAAYDAEDDSLTFEMSTPRGQDGQTVQGYFTPETSAGGTFNLDPHNGLLTWCTPTLTAEYNVAFIVREWRKDSAGHYQQIGYVLRDMQIVVLTCPTNNPPTVAVPPDTCVEAGTLIQKQIGITDVVLPPNPASGNHVTLQGLAGAFSAPPPQASLGTTFAITPYTTLFSWQTSCDHIRLLPYQSVFKVQDQGPDVGLVNFKTYSIKVVPPSVKNVAAVPQGSSIKITWSAAACNPSGNPLVAYKIYRKNDCSPFIYTPCATGISSAAGFLLAGQVPASVTAFTDNGPGLAIGNNYSYVVVAVYRDGSESYASSQLCTQLKRNVPVLLNVDVRSTSSTNGSVYLRWLNALTDTNNFDTLTFPGPYRYELKCRLGNTGSFNPVATFASPYFLGLATTYTHSPVNTTDSTLYYEIEFFAGASSIGTSQAASSVFLKAIGSDRTITLTWKENTPWHNYNYTVYRKDPAAATYTAIGNTTLPAFVDTSQVVNRHTYCYKILGEGQYSDPAITRPLLNYSQEVCALAWDYTPPCSPGLKVDADCQSGFVKVSWNSPPRSCDADVIKHVLFYKPTLDGAYAVIDTFPGNITAYQYDGLNVISGCYALQSVDSSGNASPLSTDFCIDNCPEFELPNIFSPNNDKANDVFKAVKVRAIKEIELTVFDRWGNAVYQTRDPYFQWDGTSSQSKLQVSEGTFFYVCTVFELRLTGIRTRQLKGYLQVVR